MQIVQEEVLLHSKTKRRERKQENKETHTVLYTASIHVGTKIFVSSKGKASRCANWCALCTFITGKKSLNIHEDAKALARTTIWLCRAPSPDLARMARIKNGLKLVWTQWYRVTPNDTQWPLMTVVVFISFVLGNLLSPSTSTTAFSSGSRLAATSRNLGTRLDSFHDGAEGETKEPTSLWHLWILFGRLMHIAALFVIQSASAKLNPCSPKLLGLFHTGGLEKPSNLKRQFQRQPTNSIRWH